MKYQEILSNKVTLIILTIIYLILSLAQYDTQDWVVQWDAIRQMLDGQGLYEIPSTTFNGAQYNAPNHPPVFFYSMLILVKLVGFYPQVVRVFLWLATLLLTYFVVKASDVDEEKEIIIANLFLAFPVLMGVVVMGVFDQLVMLLMIGGLMFSLRDWKYATLGGFLLGLGLMTKVIVVLAIPMLFMYLLLNHKIKQLTAFMTSFLLSTGSIFYYFYNLFGDKFIDQVLLWQTRRSIETNTVWFYINAEFSSQAWFWLQFYVMAVISLFLVYLLRTGNKETVYLSISTYIVVFLMVSRVVYPHYMLWVFASAFPSLHMLYKEGKQNKIYLWIFSILIASIGNGISVAYRDILTSNMLWQIIGAVVLNLSLYIIFYLNIQFTIYSSKRILSSQKGFVII